MVRHSPTKNPCGARLTLKSNNSASSSSSSDRDKCANLGLGRLLALLVVGIQLALYFGGYGNAIDFSNEGNPKKNSKKIPGVPGRSSTSSEDSFVGYQNQNQNNFQLNAAEAVEDDDQAIRDDEFTIAESGDKDDDEYMNEVDDELRVNDDMAKTGVDDDGDGDGDDDDDDDDDYEGTRDSSRR